jgi:hypothetical protein
MISPINPQLDTNTRQFHLKVMLLQSGLYLIVGLFTMITIQLVLSGDSSNTPKKVTSTTVQSIQRN